MQSCATCTRRDLAAACRPGGRVRDLVWPRTQQVVTEADDHITLIEPNVLRDEASERQPHGGILARSADGIVLVPTHIGKLLPQFLQLPDQCWRRGRAGEDAQAVALPFAPPSAQIQKLGAEYAPA